MVNGKVFATELAREAGLSTQRFPETKEEVELAEKIMAAELEKLTLDDHEKRMFEVHGIAAVFDEDPTVVADALKEMQVQIDLIDKKDAYDQAKFLNSSYATNEKFRLMFLRCHHFNAQLAAQTIVYHFDIKRELFGDGEILARDVRQSDLNHGASAFVNSGVQQVLSKPDVTGRAVMVMSGDIPAPPNEALHPAYWYFAMSMLQNDEEVQKRGFVNLGYQYTINSMDLQVFADLNRIEVAVPLRMACFHYCYTQSENRHVAAGFELFSGQDERFKIRVHEGNPEAIDFELQTFGIPVEVCPFAADGSISTTWHHQYLTALRQKEEGYASSVTSNSEESAGEDSTVIIPRKGDVLFGRTARSREHPGNMRAHNLVEKHFEAYEKANKLQKAVFAHWIVESIKNTGGRFLKQEDGGSTWVQVTDAVARQKVAHWCRHMRHKTYKAASQDGSPTQSANKRVAQEVVSSSDAGASGKKKGFNGSMPLSVGGN